MEIGTRTGGGKMVYNVKEKDDPSRKRNSKGSMRFRKGGRDGSGKSSERK